MKKLVKTVADLAAFVLILPAWLLYCLERLVLGKNMACQSISQMSSRWSRPVGEFMRRALLRRVLARVGKDVVISIGTIFSKPTAELADKVYLGAYCLLGDVRIGAGTLIADNVSIPSGSGQHGIDRLDVPIHEQAGQYTTVTVGCDCWIGSGAIVLADVGDHCVVAAGSVVTKPVDDYAIVAGNPAKQIGDRRELAEKATQRNHENNHTSDTQA